MQNRISNNYANTDRTYFFTVPTKPALRYDSEQKHETFW